MLGQFKLKFKLRKAQVYLQVLIYLFSLNVYATVVDQKLPTWPVYSVQHGLCIGGPCAVISDGGYMMGK